MITPTSKLYPSAPLENKDSEQRLEEKLIDKKISTSQLKKLKK